jgi:endo-1,4-beta-D-glucanase Y
MAAEKAAVGLFRCYIAEPADLMALTLVGLSDGPNRICQGGVDMTNHRRVVALVSLSLVACASTPPPAPKTDGGPDAALVLSDAGTSDSPRADAPPGLADARADEISRDARVTDGSVPGIDRPDTGAHFPFPQNRASANCKMPAAASAADVNAAYEVWKKANVKSDGAGGFLRVNRVREDEPGKEWTVSEGIGYGMLIAVYMDDQNLFDNLWSYEQLWLGGNGLMDWKIDQTGTTRLGTGAATDADEDMAWALVMADKQWGGKGALKDTYLNFAKKLITAIWQKEVDHNRGEMIAPGDSWGGSDITNISYYAPAYYRVFGQVTDNVDGWNKAIDTLYAIIAKSLDPKYGNDTNGLVPAWCNSAGVPTVAFGGAPTHHQYDSCRTPFRIGLDWCLFGEPRAKAYLDKLEAFYDKIGAKNIGDGYNLDGTPRPELVPTYGQAAAFVGPATVGAMSSAAFGTLMDEGYGLLASLKLNAGEKYYNESWTVMALLMLTGNFLNYAASP